jgi:DNA mismatch endonuclease (patch repair protein)
MALTRSEQMARIGSTNTTPEVALRRALWAAGLRFRLRVKTAICVPDLVFKKARVAVFVDGCFWHGCPVHYLRPRSRSDYWAEKLRLNVARDRRQTVALESAAWRVCRIWEHEIAESCSAAAERVLSAITASRWRRGSSWRAERVEAIGTEGLERWYLCDLRLQARRRQIVRERAARMWARRSSKRPRRTVKAERGAAR